MSKSRFTKLKKSRQFDTRAGAVEWANKEKAKLRRQDVGVRKEIDFKTATSKWMAKIFISVNT